MLFMLITLTASQQRPKSYFALCLQATFDRDLDFSYMYLLPL